MSAFERKRELKNEDQHTQDLLGFAIPHPGLVVIQAADGPIRFDCAQWSKMEPRCLGKPGDPGRSGKHKPLVIDEAM